MIYDSAEEQVKQSKQKQEEVLHLAEVTSLDSSGRARVKFYGDEEESGKTYSYLDGYVPAVGDKVLMVKQGNTFVILGAVTLEKVIEKYVTQEVYKLHTHDGLTQGDLSVVLNTNKEILPLTSGYSLGNKTYKFSNGYINNLIATTLTLDGVELELLDLIGKLKDPDGSYSLTMDGSELVPSVKSVINLGTSDKQLNRVYCAEIYEDGVRVYPYRVNSSTSPTRQYVELVDSILRPNNGGVISLGSSSLQYKNLYSQNIYVNGSAVTTSDKRKKKFVRNLKEKYLELFKKLRPVTFKYKNGTSNRTHTGFIAQEVEQAMTECGITNEEFGGLVIQENGEYGLRYEEFIALQTAVIQDLLKRVEILEGRGKA